MRAVTVAEELVKVQSILEAAGIEYHFTGDSGLDEVPYLSQNILSLCIKEGVTNVVKHSNGKKCTIHISQVPGEVKLVIKDDGVGLDERKKEGNGLTGMAERLELIEGKLRTFSNKGTELIITIPVVVKQKKDEAALL
jgi:two-component system sensor histidine kinase DesK